jgi:hypothetical protein
MAPKKARKKKVAAKRQAWNKGLEIGKKDAFTPDQVKRIRSKAESARSDLIQSRRHLEADEKAAAAALQRAQAKVAAQVEAIVTKQAATEAIELATRWRDIWSRYDRLAAFAEVRFSRPSDLPVTAADPFAAQRGGLQLITLPPPVIDLLQELGGLDHRWSRATGKERNGRLLDQWRKALIDDADAELDE